jgi:hypothetical protein
VDTAEKTRESLAVKRGEVVKKEPGVFPIGEANALGPAETKKIKCYHCQKRGHYKRDGRSLDREMAVKRAGKGDTGRGRTDWRGRGGTNRGGCRGSARGTGGRGERFSSNQGAPRYKEEGRRYQNHTTKLSHPQDELKNGTTTD